MLAEPKRTEIATPQESSFPAFTEHRTATWRANPVVALTRRPAVDQKPGKAARRSSSTAGSPATAGVWSGSSRP